jgi:glucose/arabinose dehydrogenase
LEELDSIIFAKGFGRITDMEMGPDGHLYVLASEDEAANVYKFMSN